MYEAILGNTFLTPFSPLSTQDYGDNVKRKVITLNMSIRQSTCF